MTGLGLSLSYGIIREHGGTIVVHSRPGEGATFVIELPVTEIKTESQVEKVATASAQVSAKEGSGKKILIIDDEEPILELLRELLMNQGYQVETARDGESGLRQAQQDHYDLIVCDWKIPGLNGQQIYERLRESKLEATQHFIFITGDVLSQKAEQFLNEHGTTCLLKPFAIEEFRAIVRKMLNSPS